MEDPVAHEEWLALEYLRTKAGFRISQSRQSDLTVCLARLRRRFEVREGDLLRRLNAEEPILDEFISEATVGETYFFRDPAQLEAIRRIVLPALISSRPSLRVWSAGCSTGEEAYTLAIILEQEGLLARSTILATDISRIALERAARGVFKPWSFRQDDPTLVSYFSAQGKNRHLCEHLRRQVRFDHLNLASSTYPSLENGTALTDLLVCRNVLIYLDETSIKAIASRFYECLADGGWLITGASDPPLWNLAPFTAEIVDGAVLYRKSKQGSVSAITRPLAPTSEDQRETAGARQLSLREYRSASRAMARAPRGAEAALSELSPEDCCRCITDAVRSEGLVRAAAIADHAIARHPSSTSLRYQRSLLLMALARDNEAQQELRSLIYLDRSLAVAHFTLATLLQRTGYLGRAKRLFENAYRLCAAQPPAEIVPLSEGTAAATLAASARAQIAQLADADGA